MKDAITLNGTTYRVVRTNNFAGLGPDPCSLCDKTIHRKCQRPSGNNIQPCELFNKGHRLAHFEK